jgi:hypothetical protein
MKEYGNGSGHGGDGRFTPGNPGGPGRPRRATERAYLAIMSEECSLEDWREITATAKKRARAGDAKSREWLAGYLVGAPGAAAHTLHKLAAEEAAGVDPVERDMLFQLIS